MSDADMTDNSSGRSSLNSSRRSDSGQSIGTDHNRRLSIMDDSSDCLSVTDQAGPDAKMIASMQAFERYERYVAWQKDNARLSSHSHLFLSSSHLSLFR